MQIISHLKWTALARLLGSSDPLAFLSTSTSMEAKAHRSVAASKLGLSVCYHVAGGHQNEDALALHSGSGPLWQDSG